jgi:hypothetical protein
MKLRFACMVVGFLSLVVSLAAQTSSSSSATAQVPPLIQFSNVASDLNGKPLTGVIGITFSLYQEQQGGSPLWLETQNVQPDSTGHYTVLLGSTTSQGLPTSIFAAGEARWLGVQVQGQEEQPRVLLVSAPYALKAGDASTIGGLPSSAFMLAAPGGTGATPSSSHTHGGGIFQPVGGSGTQNYIPLWIDSAGDLGNSILYQSGTTEVGINTTTPAATLDVNGIINAATSFNLGQNSFAFGNYSSFNAFLGFAGNSTSSAGTANTGVGYKALFNLNTSGGYNTASGYQALYLTTTGSSNTAHGAYALSNTNGNYNTGSGYQALYGNTTGSSNTANGYEALDSNSSGGNNTASGASALQSNSTGADNTANGSYALTSNTTGSNNTALGAGANVGSGALSYATAIGASAVVSESNALVLGGTGSAAVSVGIGTATPAYTLDVQGSGRFTQPIVFAPNQTFPGTGSGTITGVTAGTGLSGGGTSGTVTLSLASNTCASGALTALPFTCSPFATLGANTFNGAQTVSGNLSATGIVTGSTYQIGSNLFAFGNYTSENAFLGFSGNASSNNTGTGNTANGFQALYNNTTGSSDNASGIAALSVNTTGNYNNADGPFSLFANTTGGNNTASGAFALDSNTTGGSNTASGFQTLQSNTTGSNNTALGAGANVVSGNLSYATAIGAGAVAGASNTLALGGINAAAVSVGIGTANPAYTLDVQGSGRFTLPIVFASNQTFPGTGTITGVTAGTGLSGGGTSGNVTLNINTTFANKYYAQLGAANTFTGNQSVTGNITASGTGAGNITASGAVQGGVVNATTSFDIAGTPFAFGNSGTFNAFLGFAGNATMTGKTNTGSGFHALYSNTTGSSNTASGQAALDANTTGNGNTASGFRALVGNVSGSNNTAVGGSALPGNTTGSSNTAIGYAAGQTVGSGSSLASNNTAVGAGAEFGGSGAISNATAIGSNAEVTESNALVLGCVANQNNCPASGTNVGIGTTAPAFPLDVNGVVNSAIGFDIGGTPFAFGSLALYNVFLGLAGNSTMTGAFNTATGYQALLDNTTGIDNTASGALALSNNCGSGQCANEGTGSLNTASGALALFSNINGSGNTADGFDAVSSLNSGSDNTGVGAYAFGTTTTGSDLTCVGYDCTAGDGLSNATAIGAHAVVGASNSLVLGGTGQWAVNVGIGTTTPSNILTIAQGAGHPLSDGWTTYSSRRWKTNIQTLHGALAKVEQLRGVSYDLKDSGKHEMGVIAEEVGAVVPEVVTYEDNGKDARGVDYSRLTALLIEAVKQQEREIHDLKSELRATRQTLRKVQAQVAAAQPALVAVK